MRGRAHCSTHHTRGRALFERQVSPPHCQRKPKASKPEGQRAKTSEVTCRRGASLNKAKDLVARVKKKEIRLPGPSAASPVPYPSPSRL